MLSLFDWRRTLAAFAMFLFAIPSHAQQPATSGAPTVWEPVETALGRKGALQPGDIMRFSIPRTDMTVVVDGVTLKPALALGSWVAFKEIAKGEMMAMGDLVLGEEEVEPVMRTLQAAGVQPTALHNHLLGESPHVLYMHISAHGDPITIALAIHDALAKTHTPLGPPAPAAAPSAIDLDIAGIARALGAEGRLNGAVYQVSVPRREPITENGHDVPPSMGVATAINFQSTGAGRAVATGDFVLLGSEVNAVAKALAAHGIKVTAIHSHMLDESPRLYFMHFWGNAKALEVAAGLRAALDVTASQR